MLVQYVLNAVVTSAHAVMEAKPLRSGVQPAGRTRPVETVSASEGGPAAAHGPLPRAVAAARVDRGFYSNAYMRWYGRGLTRTDGPGCMRRPATVRDDEKRPAFRMWCHHRAGTAVHGQGLAK